MRGFDIIQGGMGVGVSNWQLARAVARRGQLGVVSGTALAVLLARRLQNGDPSGEIRQALAAFPNRAIASTVLERYFHAPPSPGTTRPPYRLTPMPLVQSSRHFLELTVAASFVEVYLARQGHSGPIGINLLEKIQMPTLASLYGAMLAGVEFVLMGAGIPRMIPGVLDALALGHAAELRVDVAGAATSEPFVSHFNPADICDPPPALVRPQFFAIISSATLAATLARKSNGRVDGFIVELSCAGGHNAPPRGQLTLNDRGEPVYGPRDEPDLAKIREIGLPFFLAGGYASPDGLAAARQQGAAGVQVGTLFAFCEESGIAPELKAAARAKALAGTARVLTDPRASPTGFPFKILELPGTLSEQDVYARRTRVCDLGYLRQAYKKPDGIIGYRCPAEPVEDYLKSGGSLADTVGRKCLCNGLFSALGLGQITPGGLAEPAVVTSGDDLSDLPEVMKRAARAGTLGCYTAADVLDYILSGQPAETTSAH